MADEVAWHPGWARGSSSSPPTSRIGSNWDNVLTESLWVSMKVSRPHGKRLTTHCEAVGEVIDWLTFYNHRWLFCTLTLSYISPMKFEANWRASEVKKAA